MGRLVPLCKAHEFDHLKTQISMLSLSNRNDQKPARFPPKKLGYRHALQYLLHFKMIVMKRKVLEAKRKPRYS